ncbi:MAG: hypoxanthine-guanine phosphoribosyltransferase [Chromatiales bacterium]|jgi:hypoxanthine phosphoribosyltransferase|nr:hypoxanthine-guanine phosphoribosyltransferase [Chromatiales bacterium]MDP6149681.1 phosphoribosyltransferase family protein [Gammaproteobacteria bacterium]MDP7094492.1 phosphoribosyltransferase family protein [Gammaproteobacteria bacterium]MDP7270050.1 phosphoribosyltransferase family protein [Gammaproteobacteria bacterium]HJP03667.1 phosphoribosyltransferase family protein [Gammaproteobacteria bacterium]
MASVADAAELSGFPAAKKIIDAGQVEAGLDRLAAKLQPHIDKSDCVLLGILTGGLFPLIRLADRLTGNFRIDFCHASRYLGNTTGGELQWRVGPRLDLKGASVIVIDDILDEGTTLSTVAGYCDQQGAAETHTAVLFIKDCKRPAGIKSPDYDAGLMVPDQYVFGCGMDLHERWRHLSSVYALREEG